MERLFSLLMIGSNDWKKTISQKKCPIMIGFVFGFNAWLSPIQRYIFVQRIMQYEWKRMNTTNLLLIFWFIDLIVTLVGEIWRIIIAADHNIGLKKNERSKKWVRKREREWPFGGKNCLIEYIGRMVESRFVCVCVWTQTNKVLTLQHIVQGHSVWGFYYHHHQFGFIRFYLALATMNCICSSAWKIGAIIWKVLCPLRHTHTHTHKQSHTGPFSGSEWSGDWQFGATFRQYTNVPL